MKNVRTEDVILELLKPRSYQNLRKMITEVVIWAVEDTVDRGEVMEVVAMEEVATSSEVGMEAKEVSVEDTRVAKTTVMGEDMVVVAVVATLQGLEVMVAVVAEAKVVSRETMTIQSLLETLVILTSAQ